MIQKRNIVFLLAYTLENRVGQTLGPAQKEGILLNKTVG
ncbi:hypothetical protein PM8797T_05345 [Gimesia maris DSM 8797]|nr:hypothetical protein PM8797T_05345 [Gimesia maris DSM 8797]